MKTEPTDTFKAANDLAIKWFEIHADQRLKVFNFFLVVSGFCIAGYFTALQAESNLAAGVVSIVLVFVSYCFKQLDRRTVQLTKLAEDYLEQSLATIGAELQTAKINFVALAEAKNGVWSYRRTFGVLFCLFAILGALGVLHAAWPTLQVLYRCLKQ